MHFLQLFINNIPSGTHNLALMAAKPRFLHGLGNPVRGEIWEDIASSDDLKIILQKSLEAMDERKFHLITICDPGMRLIERREMELRVSNLRTRLTVLLWRSRIP